jgi:hypothetical protein
MPTLSPRRLPRCAPWCALGTALLTPLLASATEMQTATAGGAVTLSWLAPAQNSDGSAVTNLAGYVIYFGRSPGTMTGRISVDGVGIMAYSIGDLAPGTWYFQVSAVNAAGAESAPSPLLEQAL